MSAASLAAELIDRRQTMIFDLTFAGDPLTVVSASGGEAAVVVDSPLSQERVLRKPRCGPVLGEYALYLDGWSIWVEHRGRPYRDVEVRLATWFAPRSIARGDARGFTALIDATDGDTGLALGHTKTGHIAAVLGGELLVGDARLMRERWHHMVLSVTGGMAHLILDGVSAGAFTFPQRTVSFPPITHIGRTVESPRVEGLFLSAVANGLIARTSAEVLSPGSQDQTGLAVGAGGGRSDPDTAPDRSRYCS